VTPPVDMELDRTQRFRWIEEMVGVLAPPRWRYEVDELAAEVDRRIGNSPDYKNLVRTVLGNVIKDRIRTQNSRDRHERGAARPELLHASPLEQLASKEAVRAIEGALKEAAYSESDRKFAAAALAEAQSRGTVRPARLSQTLGFSRSYGSRVWRQILERTDGLLRSRGVL
jgi:hypothetical protein